MEYSVYLRKNRWMCSHCEYVTTEPWTHKHWFTAYSWHRVIGVLLN